MRKVFLEASIEIMGTQSSEVESESNKLKQYDGVCDERRGGRQGFRRPTVAVSMPRWMALNKNEQLQKASFSSIHAFKDSVSP